MTLGPSRPLHSMKPVPPLSANKINCADKRFTLRDGFHLKHRNDVTRAAIDQQLLPEMQNEAPVDQLPVAQPENQASVGPSHQHVPPQQTLVLMRLKNRDAHSAQDHESNNNNRDEQHEPPQINVDGSSVASTPVRRPLGHRDADDIGTCHPEVCEIASSCTASETTAIAPRLQPTSDWLIYRHRPNETPRRREQHMERLLQEALHGCPSTQPKVDETMPPTRPRHQSVAPSTYQQRVAAARSHRSDRDIIHNRIALIPLTDTERLLTNSRESTNKDVDRLLVSLLQTNSSPTTMVPTPPNQASPHTYTNPQQSQRFPFSTRRSIFREQTAVVLKGRNLHSRMNELRTLPQVLEQIAQQHRLKQQQNILEHGKDLVRLNKQQIHTGLLQRPPLTPVFPSAIEQKQQQASKRKQELGASQELVISKAVNRWHNRRMQRQEQRRRHHHQCQWLLLVILAYTTRKWFQNFDVFKKKRDFLHQLYMAKKIQRMWRQQVLVRRNSLSAFACELVDKSVYYRMPIVLRAIRLLQRCIRAWLERKRWRDKQRAIEIIIVSWLEFQDVKFRRLILRFRKRVRHFQIMWRTWRSITDARIKLLLHVWAKLEKKTKRRHGLINFDAHGHLPPGSKTLSLIRALNAGQVSEKQQQKRLEVMHRHLRNGGTIQTPISATTGVAASARSPSRAVSPSSPTRKQKMATNIRHDIELRAQMGADFQSAMQDFYMTNNNLNLVPLRGHHPQQHPSVSSTDTSATSRKYGPISPASSAKWLTQGPAGGLSPPSTPNVEKIPLHIKISLLRQLISKKRRLFRETREQKRAEWSAKREEQRRIDFRFNVIEEMVAYQRFEATNGFFLLLHTVSESEMLQLMSHAQQLASAAADSSEIINLNSCAESSAPPSDGQSPNPSLESRRSSLTAGDIKSHFIMSIDASMLEIFDDTE